MNNENYELIKFGDLTVGDKLIGSNGELVNITNVYDKHLPQRMYEIEMEDGEVIQASGSHLWYCESEEDINNQGEYFRLANVYFENNSVPDKDPRTPYYPMNEIIKLFGDSIDTQLFIEKACRSLGYSSVTPHIVIEDLRYQSQFKVNNYDYNDLIEFLNKMRDSVLYDNGYFYCGEVRTTEEIFNICSIMDVNIPHVNRSSKD